MKFHHKFIIVSVVVLWSVLVMLGATVPVKADPFKDTGVVTYGNYKEIMVGSWTSSTSLQFKVSTNATVDIYVLTSTELMNYPSGQFNPVKAVEKTMNADFKITSSSSESYMLIIDNVDNSRSTDAIPTGDVSYTATYPNYLDSVTQPVQQAVNMCLISVVIVVIIVIVVIVLIIYFVVRKKPAPQQPVVQYAVAPQPVQPQYQPVYQQQPPPQYGEPPSPYEPPPPDMPYQQPPR